MVKRIPCKVIKTSPLGWSDNILRNPGRSNNNHCNADDVIAAHIRPEQSENPATHPEIHKPESRTFIDTGQVLDFYA